MTETAVIIVNWNGRHLLKDCLDSLAEQIYKNFTIFLVDNNSADGSAEYIQKYYPAVEIIRLKKNYGFAQGNNIGIKKVLQTNKVEFIVTLNNDTIADHRWLLNLVAVAKKYPNAGSCASKAMYESKRSIINTCGVSIYQDGQAKNYMAAEESGMAIAEKEIFGPSAVAALYKRKALEDIGLFDERFFMYLEDVDLAWRLRFGGYASYLAPQAIIYHQHSATSKRFSAFKVYHAERNRIWLVYKNFPLPILLRSIAFTVKRYWMLAKGLKNGEGVAAESTKTDSSSKIFIFLIKAWVVGLAGIIIFIPKRIHVQQLRKKNKISNRQIQQWFRDFGTTISELVYKY